MTPAIASVPRERLNTIAHDLNNELTVILNVAAMLGLADLERSALRCAAITRALLLK